VVPVVAVGYDLILTAVEQTRREARSGSRDERVLSEVAAHLREDVLAEDPEVRMLVRELWRSHGRAMQLALKHRPRLDDIRDLYVRLLSERFEDSYFEYYPYARGKLREIKMNLASWDEEGFPFTFMLHTNIGGQPHVRVLIWRDRYKAHSKFLTTWARRVNTSAGPLIDENFNRIRGWDWHKIFREEDHPQEAVLDEQAFDEGTAEAAVGTVTALVEQLRPYVKAVS
jgi:hypothetical protein